jgi:hypothetical protein
VSGNWIALNETTSGPPVVILDPVPPALHEEIRNNSGKDKNNAVFIVM